MTEVMYTADTLAGAVALSLSLGVGIGAMLGFGYARGWFDD